MKIFLIYISIIIVNTVFISCTSTQEATQQQEISQQEPQKKYTSAVKILSINTLHLLQDKTDVEKFAIWLKSTEAEIITLQQIERPTEGKSGFNAAAELAKAMDMRFTFGKARYYKGFDSGNMVLSMYPLQQSNTFSLPVGKGKVRRGFTYGVFDIGVKSICVASTELDEDSESERTKQVKEILSLSKSLSDFPLVIGGSFYENEKGKSVQKMQEKCVGVQNSIQHIYAIKDTSIQIQPLEKKQYSAIKSPVTFVQITIQ